MQETYETRVRSLGREDPLEEAIHSSVLAWRIPWAEKPGRLRIIGSHSQTLLKLLSMHAHIYIYIYIYTLFSFF